MSSKAAIFACAAALTASAQSLSHKIDLPKDSPVALLSADFGNSTATPRGGAYQVDVRAVLSFRNTSPKRTIRGVVLAVQANDLTAGGKGSVARTSLNVAPGEAFPVRIEMSLLRPISAAAGGPAVEVRLDGVLFDDLSFYGPDVLSSQRTMTVWEMEARRDRERFKSILEASGPDGLSKEMILAVSRRSEKRPGVQMGRGRATNVEAERDMQFAFLQIPESPVAPVSGAASVSANQARAPHFVFQNRSPQAVEHLEIGWIVKNQQGREFLAASIPADVKLAPNQTGEVRHDALLRLGESVPIQSMTGFVASVTFAGGGYWIPSSGALANPRLREFAAPSPEEQRLVQIYQKKGLDALIEELRKF